MFSQAKPQMAAGEASLGDSSFGTSVEASETSESLAENMSISPNASGAVCWISSQDNQPANPPPLQVLFGGNLARSQANQGRVRPVLRSKTAWTGLG